MATHPDVLVLGGGVIGLTTAFLLAREGVSVSVVDRSDFGQEASWAGAGILPPGNLATACTPFDRLRALSVALFPRLSAELRERTGIDNGYRRCGGLEFCGDHGDATDQEWRSEGIVVERVSGEELRRLEPALADGVGAAYHLPEMAQVRNPRHLKALIAACQANGVTFRPGCPVHGWQRQGGRIIAARSSDGSLTAGRFLLATGAWSEPLLEQLGCRPGVRPIRGQIALLQTGTPLFQRVLMQGKCYLVPRADSRVLVGSTEEDVGFDKRTTAAAIGGLLAFACTLVPALGSAHLERCWAGLRPGSPDDLPFLGPVPGLDNLFVATGHFRAGLQLSPGSATVLTELLLGRPLSVPLEPFRLDRTTVPQQAAFRS